MATLHVDTIAAYRWIPGTSWLAWSEGKQPPGTVLHSSNKLGELLQWLCHDDSTTDIGLGIIIIIIVIIIIIIL